jgi:hypothetical protein
MKKLIIVLVLLFAATALFGQIGALPTAPSAPAVGGKINLGNFPAGKWLDSNYDAIWELSSNNLRILDSNSGNVYWDFSDLTIQNFKVGVDGLNPVISFSCPEAGRSYSFKATPADGSLTLTIERSDQPKYTVTMKKQ